MATYARTYNSMAYTVTQATRGEKRWSWEVPGDGAEPRLSGTACATRDEAEQAAEAAIQALCEGR